LDFRRRVCIGPVYDLVFRWRILLSPRIFRPSEHNARISYEIHGSGPIRGCHALACTTTVKESPLSITLTQPAAFSPRPLAETTAGFREQCGQFEVLATELYADIERLGDELVHKADEVELARQQLEKRENELAEERQDNLQLNELIESQQALLQQAINEIKALHRQSAEELGELKRQLTATQSQLGDTRTQLHEAIARAAESTSQSSIAKSGPLPGSDDTRARLAKLEHERRDLEEENKLLRARATALQETVNQQRRDLAEQQAEISAELKQLRELLAEREHELQHADQHAVTLVGGPSHPEQAAEPDPVVSSVMAQFARLQRDVAQRRKKK
jgi:DNA repair exonuclease SbcCD ATPase subunit